MTQPLGLRRRAVAGLGPIDVAHRLVRLSPAT